MLQLPSSLYILHDAWYFLLFTVFVTIGDPTDTLSLLTTFLTLKDLAVRSKKVLLVLLISFGELLNSGEVVWRVRSCVERTFTRERRVSTRTSWDSFIRLASRGKRSICDPIGLKTYQRAESTSIRLYFANTFWARPFIFFRMLLIDVIWRKEENKRSSNKQ